MDRPPCGSETVLDARLMGFVLTWDACSYAYTYFRVLDEPYLVEGLK